MEADLLLMSIDASALPQALRRRLWSVVVSLSLEEGADSFSIDFPEGMRQAVGEDEGVIAELLAQPTDDRGLRHIDHCVPLIMAAGPEVISLSLYAAGGWVATVADWGDNISVLFGPPSTARLHATIATFTPSPPLDIAEADDRPPPLFK